MIGIIGMGYVGLPLMLACTAKNLRVVGFDIDSKKVKGLNPAKARSSTSPTKPLERCAKLSSLKRRTT